MATQFEIDCAVMSGRAYQSNRRGINWFPIPLDWSEKKHEVNQETGFEAVSFERGEGVDKEIVISFAGMDGNAENLLTSIDFDQSLTICAGAECADQLKEAAVYYLQVRKANPSAKITFTGHSLGGGLAALMAVFFDLDAVVFDEAPFRLSANVDIKNALVTHLKAVFSLEDLAAYAPALLLYSESSLNSRKGRVQGEYLKGEINSWIPYVAVGSSTIGSRQPIDLGLTGIGPISLHSMELLTAFKMNPGFLEVIKKFSKPEHNPVLQALNGLYSFPTDETERNFLTDLLRHQVGMDAEEGNPAIPADQMLDRFTRDLERIAQAGGLSSSNEKVSQALTAFAMQMYYEKNVAGQHLFDTQGVAGGIRFDRSKVADTLAGALGYNLYFKDYLDSFSSQTTQAITAQLPNLVDWYIQAGQDPLKATAGTDRAFMLGGDMLFGCEDDAQTSWRMAA